MKVNQMIKTAFPLLAVALLAACATKSNVKANGTTDEPVWPKPYSVTFDKHRGTFPTQAELAAIEAGMTKDELYKLIGRPHYDEGMFNVREWDYLFHFRTPGQGTDNITTCQYKVIFDKHKFARSFHWRAVDPAEAACPPAAAEARRYTLSADALFAFDKGDAASINAKGRAELDELAGKLKSFDRLQSIRITGYTDYLGSDSYNLALSQQRADTVRQYLIAQGIAAGLIQAHGAGKQQPVKECARTGSREALIACLQPNRRVEIEVNGSAPVQP